ncbi:peptidylprolyl isomerase [Sulfurivirga sp.]|uniref:peptidylprolyl isomerase n=1 Tax=Sulfurivirga sp. TaxID=2614236 RepID=UPI0025D8E778|nr:peptidylprolyl isomerase [Sulfurivirga sp.]
MTTLLRALTLLCLLALLPATGWSAQLLDRIVAVVNDQPILESELDAATLDALRQLRQQGITPPDMATLRRKVLDNLILRTIQLQRAKQRGIQVTDEEVNAQLARIAAANGLPLDAFRQALDARQPGAFEQLRRQIRDQLLIEKLRQLEIVRRIDVTEQDIDQYIRQITGGGQKRYHLRQIMLALPSAPTPEQVQALKKQADKLRRQLQQGADFAQLAVRHSNGPNALKGGDLGWRSTSELPDLFLQAVQALQPGQITPVLRSPGGFHILKLEGVEDAAPQVGDDLRQKAATKLRLRKASELLTLWLRRLRDEANIKIYLDDPATLKP